MWVPPHRSLKEINRELHTLPGAALALQVKGAIQRGRMKGKAERAARRFNHPLINKLRSEIRMVTPNDNWNLIWQKWHVHLIAIHSRMPTHTHSPPLLVCVCVTIWKYLSCTVTRITTGRVYAIPTAIASSRVFSPTLTAYTAGNTRTHRTPCDPTCRGVYE